MNILILTKAKPVFLKSANDVSEYILNDHHFNGFYNAFKKLGHNVFLNWEESYFLPVKFKAKHTFMFRLINYFMRKSKIKTIDRYLLSRKVAKFCEDNKIDLIYTELNSFISPKIIKRFYPNIVITQWFGVFPEMVDKEMMNIYQEYDINWCGGLYDTDKYYFDGIEKLIYIPCAVNEDLVYHDYDEAYGYDVVFVGGITKKHMNRADFLEAVAERFENFAFYGYGIENVPNNSKLRKYFKGWADVQTLRKLFSSSKIAINIPLDNYDRLKKGFNARLFEIAACGGSLQLVLYDEKVEEFFKFGEDLDYFRTKEELVGKIEYYITHQEERMRMVKSSKEKVKNHTYYNRAKRMLEIVEQFKSNNALNLEI